MISIDLSSSELEDIGLLKFAGTRKDRMSVVFCLTMRFSDADALGGRTEWPGKECLVISIKREFGMEITWPSKPRFTRIACYCSVSMESNTASNAYGADVEQELLTPCSCYEWTGYGLPNIAGPWSLRFTILSIWLHACQCIVLQKYWSIESAYSQIHSQVL